MTLSPGPSPASDPGAGAVYKFSVRDLSHTSPCLGVSLKLEVAAAGSIFHKTKGRERRPDSRALRNQAAAAAWRQPASKSHRSGRRPVSTARHSKGTRPAKSHANAPLRRSHPAGMRKRGPRLCVRSAAREILGFRDDESGASRESRP
jgi:hypothetical protein